eukprot:s2311_g4.t1
MANVRGKTGLLYLALAAAAVLLTLMVIVAAQQRGSAFDTSGLRGGDRALIELTLERYRQLARNVTHRLESVERAVLELRTLKSRQATPKLVAKSPGTETQETTAAPAEDVSQGASETESAPEPVFQFPNDEDPDETDEERAARREAEEKLQKSLILFEESTGKYRRYRGDFKCGSRVPLLPDGEATSG